MMNRRGMTMVELLAALALLGSVMVVLSSWVQSVARADTALTPELSWEAGAIAFMQYLADDLVTGDLESSDANRRHRPSRNRRKAGRLEVGPNQLTIETRSRGSQDRGRAGPCRHIYTLNRTSQTLELMVQPMSSSDLGERRELLFNVRDWRVVLTPRDKESKAPAVLKISLESTSGITMERRFVLREESP